jgi:hypothetical protein
MPQTVWGRWTNLQILVAPYLAKAKFDCVCWSLIAGCQALCLRGLWCSMDLALASFLCRHPETTDLASYRHLTGPCPWRMRFVGTWATLLHGRCGIWMAVTESREGPSRCPSFAFECRERGACWAMGNAAHAQTMHGWLHSVAAKTGPETGRRER